MMLFRRQQLGAYPAIHGHRTRAKAYVGWRSACVLAGQWRTCCEGSCREVLGSKFNEINEGVGMLTYSIEWSQSPEGHLVPRESR